jgi:hypothetical protein
MTSSHPSSIGSLLLQPKLGASFQFMQLSRTLHITLEPLPFAPNQSSRSATGATLQIREFLVAPPALSGDSVRGLEHAD